ncbi:MAG: PstA family ABC transporter permease [Verrucomicrobiota bacterium]|jgi:ABC-type phosphate transport system permease subunit
MTDTNHRWRKAKNNCMQTLTFVCALLVILPLLLVFFHLLSQGATSINWAFFTELPKPVGEVGGGMANAIAGTFILISLASLLGVPIGVLGGVFLSEYTHRQLNWWIRFVADIINGVPSIIWGMVVYGLLVVPIVLPSTGTVKSIDAARHVFVVQDPAGNTREFIVDSKTRWNLGGQTQLEALPGAGVIVSFRDDGNRPIANQINPASAWRLAFIKILGLHNSVSGFSTLAGAVVLGLMMIPLIMRTTEEVLQLVPNGYREAALALGISQWRMIAQIVVRTAMKGIVTGALLALARVAGETAPLLFTAFGNAYWTHKLTEPIAALPLQIFNYAISPYDDWHRQAWAGALVLILLVSAINIGVRSLTRDRFRRLKP